MTRELWRCRRCGRRFAKRNQSHACGPYTVERFLRGKGRPARTLFDSFVAAVAACGPVEFAPAKTRVGLQRRTIFAAVNRLREDRLDFHLVLGRRVSSPRVRRVESFGERTHPHHLRIASPTEIDDELAGLDPRGERVGCLSPLTPATPPVVAEYRPLRRVRFTIPATHMIVRDGDGGPRCGYQLIPLQG